MLTAARINCAEHKHSAPRPIGTAWEVQKQQHVKGTNKVWSRDRWTGVPCNPAGDRLSQQQRGGKSFEPKRETHTDSQGCKLGREHTWIYTNVSRAAPEERKQSSRRVRAGLGNRAKIQGLKNTLFISEDVQKQLLQVSFTSDRRGLPSAPNCCKIP